MKVLNRIFCVILCIILIGNTSLNVLAAKTFLDNEDNEEIKLYSVPVVSNESPSRDLYFYEYDGKYYLSLEDIVELTGCSLSIDGEIIMLTQGVREIEIYENTCKMLDSVHMNQDDDMDACYVDQGTINLLNYDEKYLFEGIPMLNYLGAVCTINESSELKVDMPEHTIWESIIPNPLDYFYDMNTSEDNIEIALILGCLADCINNKIMSTFIVDYSELEDQVITAEWISQYERNFDLNTAYQSVLESYKKAFTEGFDFESMGDLNEVAVMYEGIDTTYYTYYDVDGNGIDELLIYEGIQDLLCTSMYAYDGTKVVEVLSDILREEDTRWVMEYSSGEIIPMGCTRGHYVFDKNGYTLKFISTDGQSFYPSGELINEIKWNDESFYID